MHIKAKLYPYPVLADFNNDYCDSNFNIETSISINSNEVIASMKPQLNNDGILDLILNNKAKFMMHIECSLTCFRKVIEIPYDGLEYSISAEKIEGPMSFCPFIIAIEDIPNYSNKKLNKDYNGLTFDFEKGNILAIGKEIQLRIEKEDDDLANVPSIFAVTEIKDDDINDIVINNTGNKINIQLPKAIFLEFKLAMSNQKSMAVIHSMIIIPALMKCFDDMKSKPEDIYIYEDRRWFRALKKALKKINIELSEETILSLDSFAVSQKLMDNTTYRAILGINEIGFKGDVYDE